MTLFASLKAASTALDAAGVSIRTVGHNIANAGNENFSRQRVQVSAIPGAITGNFQLGIGVEVTRVERIVDDRIESALRQARSEFESLGSRDLALDRMEGIFTELDGAGLTAEIQNFFNAAESLVTPPVDATSLSLFVRAAESLADTFIQRDSSLTAMRSELNLRIEDAVQNINELTEQVADLNNKIVQIEAASGNNGSANDLRDRRDTLVRELSNSIDIRVVTNSEGSINLVSGSDVLVSGAYATPLGVENDTLNGNHVTNVVIGDDGRTVTSALGSLGGLVTVRDGTLVRLEDDLDTLASTIIQVVNQVHVEGVGLTTFSDEVSENSVANLAAALNQANLPFAVQNGSFDFNIKNALTGQIKTFNFTVDLDGLNNDDTTLQSLVADINAQLGTDFPSFQASIDIQNRLGIESGDPNLSFYFGRDTSGLLSSIGIGTLFTGSNASDIGVADRLVADPFKVSTGLGDGVDDTRNMASIANLRVATVSTIGGTTIEGFYEGMIGTLGVDRAQVTSLIEHQDAVRQHLENERAAISGVNIDEESVELIKFQRMFQGAARYLGVVDSMLQELFSIL